MSVILPSGHPRIDHMEMRGISKRFPGVLANDRVDFDARAGEIHALLGENGAGKSTLMKILYGMYKPDAGEILLDGQAVHLHSPADALAHNIGMIHQHFMLVPTLTVAENVALGLQARRLRLDLDTVRERLTKLAQVYGLKINPDAYIWQLSVGEQQRVEIIKALYHGGALVILDEPTAVLTPQECSELFVTLKEMRAQGHTLIFISHKLHEVQELSDRVTVMRDGRVIDTAPNVDLDRRKLARMMVGRDVVFQPERPPVQVGEVKLSIRDVSAENDQDLPALQGISLDVRAGEIVGLAGVSGNGQRELAEVIAGLRPAASGSIEINGRSVQKLSVAGRLQAGLAYVPEERNRDGIIGSFSVAENAILQNNSDYARGKSFFDYGKINRHAATLIRSFNIKTPSAQTPAKNLSGGNVQKLILARELTRKPSVLIAAQPTRGVDISATEYIQRVLLEQRSAGVAILLISEDLDEILALSDRIAVLYEGKIVGIIERKDADVETLGLMMAGIYP
ncbi:MAG: ABC transporter ATP-binding protein [Chloroflexota bacterium]